MLNFNKYWRLPLVIGLATSLIGCGKQNPIPPVIPVIPDLPVVTEEINAAQGGVIETGTYETGIYKVEFPPNSLSQDTTVEIGAPDEIPNYPVSENLEQASSFLDINLGSASLVDTCYIYIPYSGFDNDNPPMPFLFNSSGNPFDIARPSSEDEHVKINYFNARRDGDWIAGLFDFIDYVQVPKLTFPDGFDFNSSDPVILLVHGQGGSAETFNELNDPQPTMYEFLKEGYNGRIGTWEYPSILSVDVTGFVLEDKIAELEAEHGTFPFKFDVVTHSRGGLDIRYFVRNGNADKVNKVVFLGTPNNGTTIEAAGYHLLFPPERSIDDWFNPWSSGFLDCLTGSSFLNSINTSTSEEFNVDYYPIAGSISNDNPCIPGEDDHLVGVASVDLHNFPHENVRLHSLNEIDLSHGRLVENRRDLFIHLEDILNLDNPSLNGFVVFSAFGVIIYYLDTGETERLGGQGYTKPGISRDGEKISFSKMLGEPTIHIMNDIIPGGEMIPITPGAGPSWSPDGNELAYMYDGDIWIVNVNTLNKRNLTNSPSSVELYPDWSPLGDKIAFNSDRDGILSIYTIPVDGGIWTRLTSSPWPTKYPSWSPDGNELVFYTHVGGGGKVEIFKMNSDGTNNNRLVYSSTNYTTDYPSWSYPNGDWICFRQHRTNYPDIGKIYYVDSEIGGFPIRLTPDFSSADQVFSSWYCE
ncbi:MAG: hypothetical protein ABIJ20_02085 [Nanoarchaeota archaeon]|nr:hypothetical protein [Nanoarchaeota archaeon]MBU1445288.1 hypothetical protein [Nanoarchaeota archaeon]MBU2406458.1 hypothetical protein [Nanoarchaeota archaeon]MBU2420484.1 hypothetical protein [Nanoarchaeota archaeon]MBU2475091.1 hypothetical protein [Nanoarchaeota archaeon]